MGKTIESIDPISIEAVKDGWKQLTSRRNYEKEAGSILFQNLFKKCPDAQVLFGFPLDIYPDASLLLDSHRFLMHASFLIEMIDMTIRILGEDNDKLKQTLTDIGKKHATYGVKPEYFPFMTDSVIVMMEKSLGEDEFSTSHKEAWTEVFNALIVDIIAAQESLVYDEAVKNKAAVIGAWHKFTSMDNHEQVGGVLLFQHLFEVCPEAKPLFGFPSDLDTKSEYLHQSARFLKHASFLIGMVDKIISMIGVDNKRLSEDLQELGKMHATYGVKADYFPHMTSSLIKMLRNQLGEDSFSKADEVAWNKIFGTIITDMVKGQRRLEKGLAASNKSSVIKTWRVLANTTNYQEQAGIILFKHLFEDLPEAKPLFGFPRSLDYKDMAGSKRFMTHAAFLIDMVEKALNMLGENDDDLTKMMYELGEKHVKYGVKAEYFPFMKKAIVAMMQEKLAVKFTDLDKHAWEEVLGALIVDMSKAHRDHTMNEIAKSIVV